MTRADEPVDELPEDWDAPPSAEELAEAAKLREALDGKGDDELAESLRSAWKPDDIDARRHEAIVEAALAKAKKRGKVIRIGFAATVLAAAAGFAIVMSASMRKSAAPSAIPTSALVPCRSTQDLFDEPFPREGGESARIDRIATAREKDFRANLFARWGVR